MSSSGASILRPDAVDRLLALLSMRGADVGALSIRNLDDEVIARLRVRAARHGRSMEAEVRAALTALAREEQPEPDLMSEWRRSFAELGGVELDIPPRTDVPRVPDLPE